KTLSDESLGILKEIKGDHVLILLNGKIETLYIDHGFRKSNEDNAATGFSSEGEAGGGKTNMQQVLGKRVPTKFTPHENVPKPTHVQVLENVEMATNPALIAENATVVAEVKIENVIAGTFYGLPYEFAEIIEKDGVVKKQIPVE